ncbi:MULE domain-containing protein [Vairimorpha necatrix]|uniref:MULE domain-containing protein n=1 Tax=Vairimorpha necatrix TaxID=6039 RepID=A0AAX4J889_9MICR
MNDNFKIFKGQRGGQNLIYEDRTYTLDYNKDGTKRWRRNNRSCRGAITMNEQNEIYLRNACLKELSKIKEQVATSNENSLEVIKKQFPALSTSLDITKMPSIEYLRDTIKRTRNSRLGFITGCIMDIPEVLQVDSKKNRFLRFDSGMQDNVRFIIFFLEFKKNMIEKIDTFVVDGTFKSSPQGFYQIVDKIEGSYSRAFDKCKELVTINVENFVTVFEIRLVNALRISFPEANCNGCLFHLGQAAYKRVGAMGDIEKFAFVSIRDVSVFYKDIKKFIQDNSITTTANFQLYFENNYLVSNVKREDNGGRAVANINFWNVFDRVKNEIPRTSNNAESWNRTINKRMETRN